MGMFLTSGQLGNIPTLRMWLILFQEWAGGDVQSLAGPTRQSVVGEPEVAGVWGPGSQARVPAGPQEEQKCPSA